MLLVDLPTDVLVKILSHVLPSHDILALTCQTIRKAVARTVSHLSIPLCSGLSLRTHTEELARLAAHFKNISYLTVGCRSNAGFTTVAQLRRNFSACTRAFQGVTHLKLKEADVLFESSIVEVAGFTQLQSLEISCGDNFCWPKPTELQATLAALPRLKEFCFISPNKQTAVTDEHLIAIAKACGTGLRSLTIAGDLSPLSDHAIALLVRHCSMLEKLCLTAWPHADATACGLTVAVLQHLASLARLTELVICIDGDADITWSSPVPLPTLATLRKLRFEGRPDLPVLRWIAQHPQLQQLHIWVPSNEYEKELTREAVTQLAGLPDTEVHMCLEDVRVPFRELARVSNLKSLWCSHTRLTAQDVACLSTMYSLQNLALYGVAWRGQHLESVADLRALPSLQQMTLEFCSFTHHKPLDISRVHAALAMLAGVPLEDVMQGPDSTGAWLDSCTPMPSSGPWGSPLGPHVLNTHLSEEGRDSFTDVWTPWSCYEKGPAAADLPSSVRGRHRAPVKQRPLSHASSTRTALSISNNKRKLSSEGPIARCIAAKRQRVEHSSSPACSVPLRPCSAESCTGKQSNGYTSSAVRAARVAWHSSHRAQRSHRSLSDPVSVEGALHWQPNSSCQLACCLTPLQYPTWTRMLQNHMRNRYSTHKLCHCQAPQQGTCLDRCSSEQQNCSACTWDTSLTPREARCCSMTSISGPGGLVNQPSIWHIGRTADRHPLMCTTYVDVRRHTIPAQVWTSNSHTFPTSSFTHMACGLIMCRITEAEGEHMPPREQH